MSVTAGVTVRILRNPEEDPEWAAKTKAFYALRDADVYYLPKELAEYFGIKDTDDDVEASLELGAYEVGCFPDKPSGVAVEAVTSPGEPDSEAGWTFTVDLDKLPEDARRIKVDFRWG